MLSAGQEASADPSSTGLTLDLLMRIVRQTFKMRHPYRERANTNRRVLEAANMYHAPKEGGTNTFSGHDGEELLSLFLRALPEDPMRRAMCSPHCGAPCTVVANQLRGWAGRPFIGRCSAARKHGKTCLEAQVVVLQAALERERGPRRPGGPGFANEAFYDRGFAADGGRRRAQAVRRTVVTPGAPPPPPMVGPTP